MTQKLFARAAEAQKNMAAEAQGAQPFDPFPQEQAEAEFDEPNPDTGTETEETPSTEQLHAVWQQFEMDPEEYPEHVREQVQEKLLGANRAINEKMRSAAEERQSGGEADRLRQEVERLQALASDPAALAGLQAAAQARQGEPQSIDNPYTNGRTLDDLFETDDERQNAQLAKALAFDVGLNDFLKPVLQRLAQQDQLIKQLSDATQNITLRTELGQFEGVDAVKTPEAQSRIAEMTKRGLSVEQATYALYGKEIAAAEAEKAQTTQPKRRTRKPPPSLGGGPSRMTPGGQDFRQRVRNTPSNQVGNLLGLFR